MHIWGSESPHASVEFVRVSPNANVSCALSKGKLYGPFFSTEGTVTCIAYLDKLVMCWWLQLKEFLGRSIFQQYGESPHHHLDVREFMDEQIPEIWIVRGESTPWLQT